MDRGRLIGSSNVVSLKRSEVARRLHSRKDQHVESACSKDKSTSTTPKTHKSKNAITKVSDLKDIHLGGEESATVPIWATCDDVRREINAYLKKSGSSKAAFARELNELLPTSNFTARNLDAFLRVKGPGAGGHNAGFYAAYVFFEKIRLRDGKGKTKKRLEPEKIYEKNHLGEAGFPRENFPKNSRLFSRKGEKWRTDQYGKVHLQHLDGSVEGCFSSDDDERRHVVLDMRRIVVLCSEDLELFEAGPWVGVKFVFHTNPLRILRVPAGKGGRQTSFTSGGTSSHPAMADNMSLTQLPLTLIVAATTKNGIGKNGGLPWPMLKKDMAYFSRVTKRVPIPENTGSLQSDALKESILEGTSRNVVIMGRKTWESIPPKRRPLPDRTNIVISSQERPSLGSLSEDVVVASDILSGLRTVERMVKEGKALPATRAFIIGGSSIYKAALELPQTNRILMTRISKDYDCDTFFPDVLKDSASGWQKASHAELQTFAGEPIEDDPVIQSIDEEEISMEFQLYERN